MTQPPIRLHPHPVFVAFLLARPNQSATQTGWGLSGWGLPEWERQR